MKEKRYQVKRILHRAQSLAVFSITMACMLSAQESGTRDVSDSSAIRLPVNQSLYRSFYKDVIFPPPPQGYLDNFHGFMHQSLTLLPSSLSQQFQQQIDLTSPWKQELARQNEYRTLWLILGSIQAGGTAYLLYKHIEKYGLK